MWPLYTRAHSFAGCMRCRGYRLTQAVTTGLKGGRELVSSGVQSGSPRSREKQQPGLAPPPDPERRGGARALGDLVFREAGVVLERGGVAQPWTCVLCRRCFHCLCGMHGPYELGCACSDCFLGSSVGHKGWPASQIGGPVLTSACTSSPLLLCSLSLEKLP